LLSAANTSDYVVKNLIATDIPDDDGSGLQLSWTPLPKEARIIEYRVYRGVSKDSLFYIGKVPVNAKTGVASDVMYYYDKDYNNFFDITNAPAKLKKEEKQPSDSPLYQTIPRDLNVMGPLLSKYRILGVIPKDEMYYHTKKYIKKAEKEGEEDAVMAGVKANQIYLAKKLRKNSPYYYTVVAVNDKRTYFDHAEPIEGYARDNSPEKTQEFYSVYLKDLNRLQFEWSLPTFKSDIATHNIYLLKKDQVEQFKQYVAFLEKNEEYDLAKTIDPESTVEAPKAVENPATLVFSRGTAFPSTSMSTAIIDLKDNMIVDEEAGINVEFDPNKIDEYCFVFSLKDHPGYETFSDTDEIQIATKSDLPVAENFIVRDKINDKGDYNTVMWEKPVVFLTRTSFTNASRQTLLINYDIRKNDFYKIKNIYFTAYDVDGNKLEEVNEFYQDNKVSFTSKSYDFAKGLNVEIKIKANKDLGKDYVFTQELKYDSASLSLSPEPLKLGNDVVSDYEYLIYKKAGSSGKFRLSKKMGSFLRQFEDNIRYESSIFKGVSQYDAEQQLFLVDPTVVLTYYDEATGNAVASTVYAEEANKEVENIQKEIKKYETMRDTTSSEELKVQVAGAIEYYQGQLEGVKGYAPLQEANKITNSKKRMKFIGEFRERIARTYQYKIVKTNGKGLFTISEIYADAKGNTKFFPQSEWFNTTAVPMMLATFVFGFLVFIMVRKAKSGEDMYIRPIAGIQEIDNAIGRATEMGRPILFIPGMSGISDVATIAGLSILGRVAKKAAEYDTRIIVPCKDYIVLPIAQEIVKEAHYEAGRPDTYDKGSVFFLTMSQFAYVAGVNGIMIREKSATNFYMGMFFAESLIMTETGNATGAVQISGTDAITQIPFFITTCDYTLIGEELYAAAAYLAREPLQMGTLKAQDFFKFLILSFITVGTILSTAHVTFFINAFPEK
jgi:hypothetical protein